MHQIQAATIDAVRTIEIHVLQLFTKDQLDRVEALWHAAHDASVAFEALLASSERHVIDHTYVLRQQAFIQQRDSAWTDYHDALRDLFE